MARAHTIQYYISRRKTLLEMLLYAAKQPSIIQRRLRKEELQEDAYDEDAWK